MINQTGEEVLSGAKRFLFASTGTAALACPLIVCLAVSFGSAPAIRAQTPDVGLPAFDAASIKPVSCTGRCGQGGGGVERLKFTPGMVSTIGPNGITAAGLILQAYHLPAYRLTGGPDWLVADRFALEAKAGDASANENQLRQMLQTLLAERFKLVTHRETRDLPVYVLTIAKSGTKLHEVVPGAPGPTLPEHGEFIRMAATMDNFLAFMSGGGNIDRPIVDKTGLTGIYFFGLRWDGEGDAKAAIEDSFGLKFEAQKAAVDIVVIDHVEKPSEN